MVRGYVVASTYGRSTTGDFSTHEDNDAFALNCTFRVRSVRTSTLKKHVSYCGFERRPRLVRVSTP